MAEFLNMGGYAFYVWTSFGITAVVLIANYLFASVSYKRQLGRIQRRARREENAS